MKSFGKKLLLVLFFISVFLSAGHVNAASVTLDNAPDYKWYLGCSPTSAAMMMGYYDINGYQGLSYENLLSGGTAELNSYTDSDSTQFLANIAIESLADYMGTDIDDGGSTTFYTFDDGRVLNYSYISMTSNKNNSGMYGIYEYVTACGYDVLTLYNQLTDNYATNPDQGFSFDDYMNQIDDGRVVMIHIEGHTMFGYGYEYDLENEICNIIFHDTWTNGDQTMAWAGSYSDRTLMAVTVLELGGGALVPVPSSIMLLGISLLVIIRIKRQLKN